MSNTLDKIRKTELKLLNIFVQSFNDVTELASKLYIDMISPVLEREGLYLIYDFSNELEYFYVKEVATGNIICNHDCQEWSNIFEILNMSTVILPNLTLGVIMAKKFGVNNRKESWNR